MLFDNDQTTINERGGAMSLDRYSALELKFDKSFSGANVTQKGIKI